MCVLLFKQIICGDMETHGNFYFNETANHFESTYIAAE